MWKPLSKFPPEDLFMHHGMRHVLDTGHRNITSYQTLFCQFTVSYSPERSEKSERQRQDVYPNDSYIFKDSFIFILYMSILHVCVPHEYSCSLRVTDHLELELPRIMSHHVGVESQI